MVGICASWWWSEAHAEYALMAAAYCALSREPYVTQSAVPSHFSHVVGHAVLEACQRVT